MKRNVPTIKEIAEKAEVSTASVSMILSGKKLTRFSEETIQKVLSVAKELGYTKAKTGRTIIEVCPTVFNPYYSTIIQGIDSEAFAHGMTTMVYNTYWDVEREKAVLNFAENPSVCGVIFAMIPQQHETALLLNSKIPVVAVGDYNENIQLDGVDINNYNAGSLIGNHLIELGHKHIAFVSTSLNNQHSARTRRLEGLEAACKASPDVKAIKVYSKDISPSYELQNVNVEYETGYELAKECIKKSPEITAIVATNDMVAYGVINAIQDCGFKIPQDYSVCGFDNIFPSKFNDLHLTTIDHCITQKGRKAVNLLISRLGYPEEGETVTRIEYKSKLIARGTTDIPRS
ncbi:MAG: LacI family transcriptional regulator [Treponema sp.]|nr:LacI family transcriptional regulator [Treponema sp.]